MDPRQIQRILVPTDFSPSSREAVSTAIAFARAFQASIELVHVYVEPTYVLPPPMEVATFSFDTGKVLAEVDRSLNAEQERVRTAGVKCEGTTLSGRPHVEIVEYAVKQRADLIVMGTHGRGGLSHAILGSVAERVVHRAVCPVLVVPARHLGD
jgi:nucleotide-binding universal stress UspA family protein